MARQRARRLRPLVLCVVLLSLVGVPVRATAAVAGYLTLTPQEGHVDGTSFAPGTIPTFNTPGSCPSASDSYVLRLFGPSLPAAGVVWTAGTSGFSTAQPFAVDAGLTVADATTAVVASTALSGTYTVHLDCVASADPATAIREFTTTMDIDGAANHWMAGTNPGGGSGSSGGTTSTPDPQVVQVTVPTGTLAISTPYTADAPFSLGDLQLSPDGTYYLTSAAFGTLADPDKGITVVDTRAGDLGWAVSATTTDFIDGAGDRINGENLGFTDLMPVFLTDNALQSGIVATDQPAATPPVSAEDTGSAGLKGPPHLLASTDHGIGTVHLVGTMTLTAPTSTRAGTYTATVTFTIV